MTCLDDATVLGLVEGRLAVPALAAVDDHLDRCESCRDVVALVARSKEHTHTRGETIGRYVLGDLLGTGAMGRVYSAWEPELDRRVAIKVLREDLGRDSLVREAQAMARLNHPNVVTVHEVGTTSEGVFVAMELVEGETLRAWAKTARPWREQVRVLVETARGIGAVHAAGVIHRDVKPDNVIVGADRRVRIGDFGLARARDEGGTRTPEDKPLATGTPQASSVAGTPAYMAPEVLRGQPADPASDQFSFGVTAYEVISGVRPFGGTTWSELLRAVEAGNIRALERVPSWLDAAIRRCLTADPTGRFPSMAALADTLENRTSRRRPVVWIAGAAVLAMLASGMTWLTTRDTSDGCAVGERELGAVWNAQAQARARWDGPVRTAIDRWADGWIAERDATCRVHEPAPRLRCLDQRRGELAALLGASTSTRMLDALAALPPPAECRIADTGDPLPVDRARATLVSEVEAASPALRAAIAGGNARAVIDATVALVAKARASGHQPTLADALLLHADALRATGQLAQAALTARDAVAAAQRGHVDLTAAQAWIARVAIAGELRYLDTADDLGTLAQADVDRVGAPSHLAAVLSRIRGLVAYNRGHLEEARALLIEARRRLGEVRTVEVANIESALGSVARAAGDFDEAEQRHRTALAIDRELRGANHPDVARDLHNLAGVLRLRGDLDHALATYREALAIEIATQGDRSAAAGLTHNSIGLVLMAHRQWPDAVVELTLARDLLVDQGDRAFAEHNLGLVEQARGDHRAALAHFARASGVYKSTIGDDAAAPARLVLDRARSELALGDLASARQDATVARTSGIEWIAGEAGALLADARLTARGGHLELKPAALPHDALGHAATPPPATRDASPPPTIAGIAAHGGLDVSTLPPVAQPPPKPQKDVGVYGASQRF